MSRRLPVLPVRDIAFATKVTWIGLGLGLGFVFGLAYALVGFAIGCGISMLKDHYRQANHPANPGNK